MLEVILVEHDGRRSTNRGTPSYLGVNIPLSDDSILLNFQIFFEPIA